tara:strand:- start:1 stop:135 length:135 start_codon:yes stop_codon:yes gene_type:complete
MDNVIKQTTLLAKLNAVMDMQIYILEQRKKLEEELKQLEEKKDE